METSTNYPELLDDKQHKMGYYGFRPEKKYGKQGFCDTCNRNFVLKIAFNDKYIYPDKTVWIGACPHCGATIRMVDKIKSQAIMGMHPGYGKVTPATDRDRTVTMSAFKWALTAILGLRKYYKNQIRCIFLTSGDSMIDDGVENNRFYEYEREYYEYNVVTMIKTIKELPLLEECWWKTVDEIKEYINGDVKKRKEFVACVKDLIDAVEDYEKKNWEKFFGAEACMHVNEEGFQPHIENFNMISKWTKTNNTMLTEFKTTRMPTEYETDEVLESEEIEKEIERMDTRIVNEEKAQAILDKKAKTLDELEFGIDAIPDV